MVEKSGRKNNYSLDQMVELRREKSDPVFEQLYDYFSWLSGRTPPKGLLDKAVNYELANWPVLVRYLEEGHIPSPDNLFSAGFIAPT